MKHRNQDILLQENFGFDVVDVTAAGVSTPIAKDADAGVNRYKQNGEAKKILGAVYTPPGVASALVRWAVRSRHDRILDPSCGDGVFLKAAKEYISSIGNQRPLCIGVDINPQAAADSQAICSDFFEWASTAPKFDATVGNPPFIRSHLFPKRSRAIAFEQMKRMGLHPSRLMSTWVPFVALSCKLLTENGRLALVVPEELLHVSYAEELRHFLLKRFRRVIICVPNGSFFNSVQQSVVLLLCDNESAGHTGLLTTSFSQIEESPQHSASPAPCWNWTPKWTHVFLSPEERSFISEAFETLDWKPFREYGRIEVGVVTGYNDFFIVPESRMRTLKARKFFTPVITSARELQGLQFTAEDFNNLADSDTPLFLLNTSAPFRSLPRSLREYLSTGIKEGIHQRYKCKIREPWYAVPSIWPADAIMLRQAGEIPRIVHRKKYTSTDTVHRVRWRKPSMGKIHAASFLNTFTLIAYELTGRSYGGGVLELMPSEANRLPLPPPDLALKTVYNGLDELTRFRQFDKAIELVDQFVTLK